MPSDDRDTGTPNLLARLENGVLTLTLNRPESRNAMTVAMLEALDRQLSAAEIDDGVRCVVLTGAGKGFCSGGDVKGFADKDKADEPATSVDAAIHLQRLSQRATAGRLHTMPKPTICGINGAAAGAGLSLALACDLRIMSTAAFLMTAFANVGLSGDYGGTVFLSRLVGTAKARELYFLSDRVQADEALRLGLVNWTCEPDALAAQTTKLASRLAAGPGVAYRYMKENLNRAIAGGVEECMDLEATHHVHCFQTDDHKGAVQAFVEKRQPTFAAR